MGGSKKQTSSSTQNTTYNNQVNPWAPAQAGYIDLLGRAQAAQAATPTTPFTGDLWARPVDAQRQAQDSAMGVAGWAGNTAQPLNSLALDTIAGKFLDPTKNIYLQNAISGAIDPLREQLGMNLNKIAGGFAGAGAYGGDRQGVVEANAVRGFNRDAMNLAAGMNYNNYTQERQLQQNAPALASAAIQLGLQPSAIMGAVGDQQQEWNQAQLNEALQKHQMAIDAPWAGLDRLAQIMQLYTPFSGQSGTSNTQGTQTQKVPGGGIGGILGGAAAGSAFGPWGAAIGGLAGAFG